MNTEHYPYKVAAVYPDSAAAEAAVHDLNIANLGDVEVVQLEPGTNQADQAIEPEGEQTRDTVVNDTVTGSAVGTAAGAVVTGAAALGTPALFISAPVVGPLMLLGYGAMIGGTVGAIRGLKLRENMLSGLVKDALKEGYHVVIIHAASEQEQQRVQDVINTTMPEDTAQYLSLLINSGSRPLLADLTPQLTAGHLQVAVLFIDASFSRSLYTPGQTATTGGNRITVGTGYRITRASTRTRTGRLWRSPSAVHRPAARPACRR